MQRTRPSAQRKTGSRKTRRGVSGGRTKRRSGSSQSNRVWMMLYQSALFACLFYVGLFVTGEPLGSRVANAQTGSLPFQPLGSPSQVDPYRSASKVSNAPSPRYARAVYSNPGGQYNQVRQVAMQGGGFNLPFDSQSSNQPAPNQPLSPPPSGNLPTSPGFSPPNNFSPPASSPPPITPPPNLLPRNSFPITQSPPATSGLANPPFMPQPLNPRTLPTQPNLRAEPNLPSFQPSPMADYQPLSPPQIANGGFATMNDCRLITPGSSYTAMSPYGCGGCDQVAPATYAAPYVPTSPIGVPGSLQPVQPYAAQPAVAPLINPAPIGSLVSFGQERNPVQVGPGLWGQPVAYVPGQKFRNWLRYLSF